MSVEEDTELRDLIAQTLEANGCFARIRAQLRASIYLALDEDESLQKKEPMLNMKLKAALGTEDGKIMFRIVREFLKFYDLQFTLSVFEPETYLGTCYEFESREKIIEDLKLQSLSEDPSTPLLLQIIKVLRSSESNSRFDTNGLNKTYVESANLGNRKENFSKVKDISLLDNGNVSPQQNEINGNETFEVNFPIFNNDTSDNVSATLSDKLSAPDFSMKEKVIGLNNSPNLSLNNTADIEKLKTDQSTGGIEVSPPILKDGKYSKFDVASEKLKLSAQKIEKVKRNNMSSFTDLPPIPITKSRSNEMLLPPLYTKELKDMNTKKELEKLFDLGPSDNYEEDFISESELDLVLNKGETAAFDGTKINMLERNTAKNVVIQDKIDADTKEQVKSNSTVGSITSDDMELDSIVDDILNSI